MQNDEQGVSQNSVLNLGQSIVSEQPEFEQGLRLSTPASVMTEEEQPNFMEIKTKAEIESYMQEKFQKIMRLDGVRNDQVIKSLNFNRNQK